MNIKETRRANSRYVFTCTWCEKGYTRYNGKKDTDLFCCDACAIKFISEGMDSQQLKEKGVHVKRAKELGWKPILICDECHRSFPYTIHRERYCYREDCPSCFFKKKKARTFITKSYENNGEPGCKRVVCIPVDDHRDVLISKFPGIVTKEEFNETRRIIMKVACKEQVTPRCIASALFYMTIVRLHRCLPKGGQNKIADTVKASSASLRKYVVMYGYIVSVYLPRKTR
jgi:hypothetical protein